MKQPVFHKIGYNFQTEMVDFIVTLGGSSFSYSAGIGCFPANKKATLLARLNWIEHGYGTDLYKKICAGSLKPSKNIGHPQIAKVCQTVAEFVTVSADDFFYSLLSDMRAGEVIFDDFCSDFGYDSDSRKAFTIYEACQQNAKKLRAELTRAEIEELEKKLENY